MSKQSANDPVGLLLTIACVAALFAFINSCASANGGTVCRQCVRQQAVVAPSLAYQPAVQYMIGQNVRQESVDVAAFRHSPEWQEYLQLKAYKQGIADAAALAKQQPAADVEPPKWTPTPEQPADDEPLPLPGPLPEEPVGQEPTPVDDRFAGIMSTIVARCAKCHTGDEPKGSLWLDGSVDLTSADGAEKRDSIVRALLHGHMPPAGQPPVSDAEFGSILYELYPATEETK